MSKKRAVLGILLTRENTCVLLLKRSPNSRNYPNKYSFPGGTVEIGETDVKALPREFWEETTKKIIIEYFYCVFHNEEYEVHVYYVEDITPEVPVTVNPKEHSAYHEFTLETIHMHKDEITPQVFNILLEIRATLKAKRLINS